MTRFDLDMDGSMEPSEHGRWVRYEDAQRPWVGLTDEEIYKIANDLFYGNGPCDTLAMCRSIEAAHGIKGDA